MMKEDKYMDQVFRDKLGDFEKAPPAFVWDNLQAKLAGQKRRTLLFYWRIAGAAAVILIAFLAGWQFSRDADLTKERLAGNTDQQTTQESIFVPENKTSEIAEATVVPEIINVQTETSTINRLAKPGSVAPKSETKQASSLPKIEKPGFIQSLQAILKSQVPEFENLTVGNQLMQKALFTADELRIIEANKNLLAINSDNSDQRKWMVGAAVSPVYSVNQSSQTAEYSREMANPQANNSLNMSGGLSFEYKTQKKWSFQSGVYYNKLEQSSSNSNKSYSSAVRSDAPFYSPAQKGDINSYFTTPVVENNGTFEMNSVAGVIQIDNLPASVQMQGILDSKMLSTTALVSNVDFDQNFEYLEIPLFVKYQLVESKIGVQLLGGVSTNILVGNNVYLQNDSGKSKVGKTNGMVDVNYSGVFGLGLNYALTSNLYLNIEPRFKYFFNSLNEDSNISYKSYNFGVYTGISYSF